MYGSRVHYHGRVLGLTAGTGSALAVLPAQNATGNWIKIVQRLSVRIGLDPKELEAHPLFLGLSTDVDVDVHDQSGAALSRQPAWPAILNTDVYADQDSGADAAIDAILAANLGHAPGTPPVARQATRSTRSRPPGRRGGIHWLIAPVVALAAFMEIMDISIANVALPHIAGALSSSQNESTWVLTSYLVTNAIIMPISGWLANTFGRKRLFLVCIAGFTAASLLCGLAPNLATLIVVRALQGATGGGLQPVGQAILADSFPQEKRGMATAIYGIAAVVAPVDRPDPRRLDHRQLRLALDLPHQCPGRASRWCCWFSR